MNKPHYDDKPKVKEEKLYFDDPLQAAYMAREFGVRYSFKGERYPKLTPDRAGFFNDFVDWDNNGDAQFTDMTHHIHPDSYSIFEPKEGDVIASPDCPSRQDAESTNNPDHFLVGADKNNKPYIECVWSDSYETERERIYFDFTKRKRKPRMGYQIKDFQIILRDNKHFFMPKGEDND